MDENRYLELGESFKTTFDVLFGPGPYELEFISVEAGGGTYATGWGEEEWDVVLSFERGTFHTWSSGCLCITPDEDSWFLDFLDDVDATQSYLPMEETDQLLIWVVSELAEAYAVDIGALLSKISSGGWGKESMDLVLERWWRVTTILEDFARGKWKEFDPDPASRAIERARLGLAGQVKWLNVWEERDLASFVDSQKSFVAFLLTEKLPELKEFLEDAPTRPAKEPANLVGSQNRAETMKPEVNKLPSPPPVSPNQYVKRQGLSTNAIAWIVALAIGAFVAIGAAMGY